MGMSLVLLSPRVLTDVPLSLLLSADCLLVIMEHITPVVTNLIMAITLTDHMAIYILAHSAIIQDTIKAVTGKLRATFIVISIALCIPVLVLCCTLISMHSPSVSAHSTCGVKLNVPYVRKSPPNSCDSVEHCISRYSSDLPHNLSVLSLSLSLSLCMSDVSSDSYFTG